MQTGRTEILSTCHSVLVVAALAVGLAMPAWGQDIDAGVAAVQRRDYVTALREWQPLAEQGDAKAQLNLGSMYSKGEAQFEHSVGVTANDVVVFTRSLNGWDQPPYPTA